VAPLVHGHVQQDEEDKDDGKTNDEVGKQHTNQDNLNKML
jgi:hypothetical protein